MDGCIDQLDAEDSIAIEIFTISSAPTRKSDCNYSQQSNIFAMFKGLSINDHECYNHSSSSRMYAIPCPRCFSTRTSRPPECHLHQSVVCVKKRCSGQVISCNL